ncbi:MAG: hypothetical protein AAEJ47_03530, partial [Planctomycetota bacterium]
LAEQLIVKKANRRAKQLVRSHPDSGAEEEIMKSLFDAPPTESMKQHRIGIVRFIDVVFVEEIVSRVRRVHQSLELLAKALHLVAVEHWNPGKEALLLESTHLL